jgi:hypothetical protein
MIHLQQALGCAMSGTVSCGGISYFRSTWETKAGGLLEPRSLRPAWATQQPFIYLKKKKRKRKKEREREERGRGEEEKGGKRKQRSQNCGGFLKRFMTLPLERSQAGKSLIECTL